MLLYLATRTERICHSPRSISFDKTTTFCEVLNQFLMRLSCYYISQSERSEFAPLSAVDLIWQDNNTLCDLKSIFSAIVVLLYLATQTERICTTFRGSFLFRTAFGVRLGLPIGSVYPIDSIPATLYTLFICSFKISVIFVKPLCSIFFDFAILFFKREWKACNSLLGVTCFPLLLLDMLPTLRTSCAGLWKG